MLRAFKLMCDVLVNGGGELLAQMGYIALLERVQPPEVVVIKLLGVHYHCGPTEMISSSGPGSGCFLY